MKDFKHFLLMVVLCASLGFSGGYYCRNNKFVISRDMGVPIQPYFSPKGGCTDAAVKAIDQATLTLLVQAYSFTSQPIEDALVRACKRGVKVRVILDRSQYEAKSAAAMPLHSAGIEVRMDNKHQIAHNKVMVIDGATVITGSFNFTRQAEIGNAENMLVISSPELAALYAANWQVHYDHSDVYNGETAPPRK